MKETHSESAEPPSGTSIDGPHLTPSIPREGQYGLIERQGATCALPRIGRVPRMHSTRAALGSTVRSDASIVSTYYVEVRRWAAERTLVLP